MSTPRQPRQSVEFVNCPNCGAQVPPDADYCPRCGRDLRPRGSFPWWLACLLAFVAGAALCAAIGLVAGVGKTDTVTAHKGGKHPPATTTVSSTKRVTVSGPTHTVKGQPATKTVHVTSTATVSTTATTTTTVSTTKTATTGG